MTPKTGSLKKVQPENDYNEKDSRASTMFQSYMVKSAARDKITSPTMQTRSSCPISPLLPSEKKAKQKPLVNVVSVETDDDLSSGSSISSSTNSEDEKENERYYADLRRKSIMVS